MSKPAWGGGSSQKHLLREGISPARSSSTARPAAINAVHRSSDVFTAESLPLQNSLFEKFNSAATPDNFRKATDDRSGNQCLAGNNEPPAAHLAESQRLPQLPDLQRLLAQRGRLLQDLSRSKALPARSGALDQFTSMQEAFLEGVALGISCSGGGSVSWQAAMFMMTGAAGVVLAAYSLGAPGFLYFPPPT